MPTLIDYILVGAGKAGVFVQLVNKVTKQTYTSSVATDPQGQYTMPTVVPPGDYLAYVSPTLGPATWTLWDPNFNVPATAPPNVLDCGLKGDGRIVTDAQMTAG